MFPSGSVQTAQKDACQLPNKITCYSILKKEQKLRCETFLEELSDKGLLVRMKLLISFQRSIRLGFPCLYVWCQRHVRERPERLSMLSRSDCWCSARNISHKRIVRVLRSMTFDFLPNLFFKWVVFCKHSRDYGLFHHSAE